MLIELITTDRDSLPKENSNDFKKLTRYKEQLSYIKEKMIQILDKAAPFLENKFKLKFNTPELLLIAFARPSTKNIFINMKIHFDGRSISITDNEFDELAGISGAGEVLALIGDAVLDMATVEMLWDSSFATKGNLTEQRKNLVSNEALAKLCDDWNFYDFRLINPHIDTSNAKETTINHEKGTLIEAIFGSIYIEYGYEKILEIIPKLQ